MTTSYNRPAVGMAMILHAIQDFVGPPTMGEILLLTLPAVQRQNVEYGWPP